MLKMLVALVSIWLMFGAAGALIVDRQRPMTISDVALGPISLGRVLTNSA